MRVRTLTLRFAVFELPYWDQGKEHPSSLRACSEEGGKNNEELWDLKVLRGPPSKMESDSLLHPAVQGVINGPHNKVFPGLNFNSTGVESPCAACGVV